VQDQMSLMTLQQCLVLVRKSMTKCEEIKYKIRGII